jgi:predicted N-formylglutamate amidohydrolase
LQAGVYKSGVSPHDALIITCEHGGNEVPADYAPLFAGHEALLQTHRGWDPGALELGQDMAAAFDAPLFASTTTRLLIDLNRSIGHKTLHSEATRALPLATRRRIAAQHYSPHRDAVEAAVARQIVAGKCVVHVASHSFAPELHGIVRPDIAWLYDSRRPGEAAFVARWLAAMRQRRPDLQLRRNYPYQGKLDGLTSLLRKRHPAGAYIGTEIEVNQRFFFGDGQTWATLRADIVAALADVLEVDRAITRRPA